MTYLFVGAQNYRNTLHSGAAFLYLGSSTGITTTVAWQDWGGQEYALYGWAVNTVGDINGDARTDIAIGAPGFDDRDADQGQVRVFHGSIRTERCAELVFHDLRYPMRASALQSLRRVT